MRNNYIFVQTLYKPIKIRPMKQNIFLICILAFCLPNIIGQNLSLKDLNDEVVSNDTVYVNGDTNDNLIETGIKITNSSSSSINVKVKKEEISVIEGTENYFCWKECYAPDVFVSPELMTIEAGATNDRSFKADYKPKQKNGVSKILYTFFNTDDTNDLVTVLIVFNVSTATNTLNVDWNKNNSKPFPVPAKDYTTIKYELANTNDVKFNVFNLQGKKIEERLINQNKGEITLYANRYKQGIYFYKFIKQGQIIDSGKIVFQ
jgi:hypothetical protein